ncbi:hypothetical protein WG66_004073 [Moniliophthora roreri]|nr:hypothetical protein WG66_004073 [Moniliophthora roreri]
MLFISLLRALLLPIHFPDMAYTMASFDSNGTIMVPTLCPPQFPSGSSLVGPLTSSLPACQDTDTFNCYLESEATNENDIDGVKLKGKAKADDAGAFDNGDNAGAYQPVDGDYWAQLFTANVPEILPEYFSTSLSATYVPAIDANGVATLATDGPSSSVVNGDTMWVPDVRPTIEPWTPFLEKLLFDAINIIHEDRFVIPYSYPDWELYLGMLINMMLNNNVYEEQVRLFDFQSLWDKKLWVKEWMLLDPELFIKYDNHGAPCLVKDSPRSRSINRMASLFPLIPVPQPVPNTGGTQQEESESQTTSYPVAACGDNRAQPFIFGGSSANALNGAHGAATPAFISPVPSSSAPVPPQQLLATAPGTVRDSDDVNFVFACSESTPSSSSGAATPRSRKSSEPSPSQLALYSTLCPRSLPKRKADDDTDSTTYKCMWRRKGGHPAVCDEEFSSVDDVIQHIKYSPAHDWREMKRNAHGRFDCQWPRCRNIAESRNRNGTGWATRETLKKHVMAHLDPKRSSKLVTPSPKRQKVDHHT